MAAPRPLSAADGPRPALFGGRNPPQPPGAPVLPAPVHGVVVLGSVGPGSLPMAELSALQELTAELLREAVCNQLLERPCARGEWLLLCKGDEAQL